MVRFLVLLLLAGACHAKPFPDGPFFPVRDPLPQWVSSPDLVIDVRWTRSVTSPAFVFGGVCHLFFSDKTEDDMKLADEQITRCIQQSNFQKIPLTSTKPEADVRRLHIHWVSSNYAVQAKQAELFIEPPRAQTVKHAPDAFYFETAEACLIVSNRSFSPTGHEIKHCFDGGWHSNGLVPLLAPFTKNR